MLENIRVVPAALFYLAYVAGLIYLVSLPALKTGAPVLIPAMMIGAMAYGTYEFTSYAIMKDWHWQMVMTDTIWGTVLTGLSAWAGVAITRAVCKHRLTSGQKQAAAYAQGAAQRAAPEAAQGKNMILYGIPTCDTCKKALKALQAAGHDVTFRDVRANPLSSAEIDEIVTEFGDRVINKIIDHLSRLQRFPESLRARGADRRPTHGDEAPGDPKRRRMAPWLG
jgi:uncharacterized membrane protein